MTDDSKPLAQQKKQNTPDLTDEEIMARIERDLDDSVPLPFEPPGHQARAPVLSTDRVAHRQTDPIFLYALVMAFSIGLSPLAADAPTDRYAVLWTLLALIGVINSLLGSGGDQGTVKFTDLRWGVAFGLMVGAPLLLVGQSTLSIASQRIFSDLSNAAVFQTLVFVMPLAETLFFRGMVQAVQPWTVTAGMASVWSILLFFPALDFREHLPIALIIGTFMVMLSALYGYVRERNGLAAAWLCQVVVSLLWLFVPRLML